MPSTEQDLRLKFKTALSAQPDYIELRLDQIPETEPKTLLDTISVNLQKCIFTIRRQDQGGKYDGQEEKRLQTLLHLSELKPAYLDLELNALREGREQAKEMLRSLKGNLIISWHDFEKTPQKRILQEILAEIHAHGGMPKIVTTARDFHDNVTILSLYETECRPLVAFCMGNYGVISRVMCPLLGSPLTYASLKGEKTAPGQLCIEELRAIFSRLEYGVKA